MLVPAMKSMGIWCCSNHSSTPMCAMPAGAAAAERQPDARDGFACLRRRRADPIAPSSRR